MKRVTISDKKSNRSSEKNSGSVFLSKKKQSIAINKNDKSNASSSLSNGLYLITQPGFSLGSKQLCYSQIIAEILNNRSYKQMFENLNFDFAPCIFLENGQFKVTFLKTQNKGQTAYGMTLSRYDETFAKMKILISKNLNDLKNSFMFYYSTKNIHFYTHYYEFLENLNNAIQYKESLKSIDNIQLIDLGTDDFYFEQLKFHQDQLDKGDPIFQNAQFYHKYNFYKYIQNLNVNTDMDDEIKYIERNLKQDKRLLMKYMAIRVVLLIQSVFRYKIRTCDCRFLMAGKSVSFSLVHRIQFMEESFVNDLFDEDEFEAIEFDKTQVSSVNFNPTRKVDFVVNDKFEVAEIESPKYKHITEPLAQNTKKYLDDVIREFQNIKAERNESEIAFSLLFPDSKMKLSELIENHMKKPSLELQLSKLQKQYEKSIRV